MSTDPAAVGSDGYDPLGSGGGPVDRPASRIKLASPVTGEEEVDAVRSVLSSGVLTNGPWTRRFEAAMAERHGTEHAVAFANGTVALAAMYVASGIEPGDEVIVPSLTFVSTATSVLHVGATPVFADVHPDTLNLDPDDVARRVTPRTKAIVPVHYGGQAADLDRLTALAEDAGVDLLEDAAEAHGATFQDRPVGSWGRAGMFSFTPTKNVTTGEGGMVTTSDAAFADRLRLLRNHGLTAPGVHGELGWNWRLSEIQAAIGCCQLDRLDGILVAKRTNAAHYADLFGVIPGVTPPVTGADRDHTWMLYTVQVDDHRDDLLAALLADGIEARVYFVPAHQQPVFTDRGDRADLPVTDALAERIVSLPFHARLTRDDLAEVARAVAAAR